MDPVTVSAVLTLAGSLLNAKKWLTQARDKRASTQPDLVATGPDGTRFVVELAEGDRVPRFGDIAHVERMASELEDLDRGSASVVPVLVTDLAVSTSVLTAAREAGVEVLVAEGDSTAIADLLVAHLNEVDRASAASTAAPVTGEKKGASEAGEEVQVRQLSISELTDILKRHSAWDRLEFRSHATLEDHRPTVAECGCLVMRQEVRSYAGSTLLRSLVETLDIVRGRQTLHQRVVDLIERLGKLSNSSLERPFVQDLTDTAVLINDALEALRSFPDDDGSYPAIKEIEHLQVSLGEFISAMNDFSAADLRESDLSSISLDGVIWSSSTLWPDDSVAQRVKDASVQTGDDQYLIQNLDGSAQ